MREVPTSGTFECPATGSEHAMAGLGGARCGPTVRRRRGRMSGASEPPGIQTSTRSSNFQHGGSRNCLRSQHLWKLTAHLGRPQKADPGTGSAQFGRTLDRLSEGILRSRHARCATPENRPGGTVSDQRSGADSPMIPQRSLVQRRLTANSAQIVHRLSSPYRTAGSTTKTRSSRMATA